MSKLSFRARALDVTKPMQVLRPGDVPDLPDFGINRAVPQLPTGMEKEEESEHHLQRAISAQQALGRTVDHVIPTPEVLTIPPEVYDMLYPPTFKLPRQPIHVHLSTFEQDMPEYNMDSDDEEWLSEMKQHLNINELKFEEMIDCLEKSSSQHQVLSLEEAKLLLKEDEGIIIAVYDYWIDKKIKLNKSLIPAVRTEKKDGTSGNNPYIAFRRRTEKMQTRKNRKNDCESYIQMLKLKKDFGFLCDIMALMNKREIQKRDILKVGFDLLEKRYRLLDFDGGHVSNAMQTLYQREQSTLNHRDKNRQVLKNEENIPQVKRKRDYKKRIKPDASNAAHQQKHLLENGGHERGFSSDEDEFSNHHRQTSSAAEKEEMEDNPDGAYAFKRKKGCNYYAPREKPADWPWRSEDNEEVLVDPKYTFHLTSLSCPPNHCIGLARRRFGRGGRIMYDRTRSHYDSYLNELSQDLDDGYRSSINIEETKSKLYKTMTTWKESFSNMHSAFAFNLQIMQNGSEDVVEKFSREINTKKSSTIYPGYYETLKMATAEYLEIQRQQNSDHHTS